MAEQRPGGEPTEPPSEKRKRDARKKGDVARSREAVSFAVLVAVVVVFAHGWTQMVSQLREYLGGAMRSASLAATLDGAGQLGLNRLLVVAAPLLFAAFGAALLANYAQVGGLFSLHPLKPTLNKINPMANAKNVFGRRAFAELLKSLAKLLGVGVIAGYTMWQYLPQLLGTMGRPPESALLAVGACLWAMTLRVGIFAAILAVVDFLHQRRVHQKKLKMTKEEVKREQKEAEGDPQHKAERQRLHREVAEHRMVENVVTADVVIVNPEHLAVAIKYDQGEMEAPKVVAKGRRLVARRIRQVARHHGIPIVRNVPLARALEQLSVDEEIPAELYEAVAAILRFVYDLSGDDSAEERSL